VATVADLREAMAAVQRACALFRADWEPVWRDLQRSIRRTESDTLTLERLAAIKLPFPPPERKPRKPRRQYFDASTHEFGTSYQAPRFKPGRRVRGGSNRYRRRVW